MGAKVKFASCVSTGTLFAEMLAGVGYMNSPVLGSCQPLVAGHRLLGWAGEQQPCAGHGEMSAWAGCN